MHTCKTIVYLHYGEVRREGRFIGSVLLALVLTFALIRTFRIV